MLIKSANMQVKTPQSEPGQAKQRNESEKVSKERNKRSKRNTVREERRTIQLARSVARAPDQPPLVLVREWRPFLVLMFVFDVFE
jgi:hypothetical protein